MVATLVDEYSVTSCVLYKTPPSLRTPTPRPLHAAQDAAYEPLHDAHAKDAVDIILKLKGFYVKVRTLGEVCRHTPVHDAVHFVIWTSRFSHIIAFPRARKWTAAPLPSRAPVSTVLCWRPSRLGPSGTQAKI